MRKVFRLLLEFAREMERGQAMMRGEIEPGTYGRGRSRQRDLRCSRRTNYIRRHAVGREEKKRFGE